MKSILLLFSFVFLSSISFSQEICNNGIDDDADGLVDLNDAADCVCSGIGSSGTPASLIPNASFENMSCCPSSYSQVNCATGWIQATQATSDYMNTCGIVFGAATGAGLVPFPNGNGILGAIFSPGWQEYVGACLTSPMVAGTSYTIEMNIASTPIDGFGDVCNGGVIDFGNIDITIFGSANCASMPVATTGCPLGSGWDILTSVNYTPNPAWGTITLTFTPTTNINAIIIGSPCTLPASYTPPSGCYPYFYYDNLVLNNSALFSPISVTPAGGICTGNATATATTTATGGTWQWYFNGVAIVGQTSATIDVSSVGLGAGDYTAVYTLTGQCDAATTTFTGGAGNPAITPAGPFCANTGNQNMAAATAGGTWSASCGACINSATGQFNTNGLAAGNYTVTYSLGGSCPSVDNETIVIENATISGTTVTDISCFGLCDGQIVINATGATQFSIDGGVTFQASNTFSGLCSGTYNIVVESATAGCQATSTATIATPTALTLPTSFVDETCFGSCDGSAIVAPQGGTAPYTYSWSSGGGNVPNLTNICAGNYTVNVTDDNGCTNSATITVSGPPQVVISSITPTNESCAGTCDGSLTINAPSATLFSIDNGVTFQAGSFFANLCSGIYSVVVQDASGCSASGNATIIPTITAPVAEFMWGPQPTDLYNTNISFLNLSTGAVSYSWDFGVFGTSNQMTPPNVIFPDTVPGTYPVCLIASNGGNCVDTVCHDVVINDVFILYVPNTFTPDNDNINELFFPHISGHDPEKYEFMIFNRWGELIFLSNTSGEGWDGRHKGIDCKVDTYVWKLVVRDPQLGKKRYFYGHVNLVR